jgi:hypothetical protein
LFDESALSLTPNLRGSWAPRGQPPTLLHPCNGKKASMAAAVCSGVQGGGAQRCFHCTAGNYDTDTLIEVLGELPAFLGGENCHPVVGWAARPPQPRDAGLDPHPAVLAGGRAPPRRRPGAEPDRGLVSSRKAVGLANLTSPTLAEVIDQAHRGIERVPRTPHLAYSFPRHAGLSVS